MYVNGFSSKNENGGFLGRRKAKKTKSLNDWPPGGSNVVAAALIAGAVLVAIGETLTPGAGAITLSRGPVEAINERIGCSKRHCGFIRIQGI